MPDAPPNTDPQRAAIEKIIWHAMSSMAGDRRTLDEARAAKPTVDGNYNLLFLSNATDAVLELLATTTRS